MHLKYLGILLPAAAALCVLHGECHAQDTLAVSKITASAAVAPVLQSAPAQSADRADIERLGMQELHEALRGFAGVSIRDYGGIGGVKTVSVRNLGAQHTAVAYDGIAMSNAQSGQIDISRFSLDNVDQVSIVIGQSDDIFQCARMLSSAGALNIKTLKPRFEGKRTNFNAQMKAGSFKTFNPSLLLERKIGRNWSASATCDWLKTDGTYPFDIKNGSTVEHFRRLNSDVDRLRAELNIFGNVGKNGELDIKANWLSGERGLPGSVKLYNPKANERLWDRSGLASAAYTAELGAKWSLKSSLNYSYSWNRYLDISEIYAGGKEDDNYTQRELSASATVLFKPTSKVRFSLAEDLSCNTLDSNIPECAFPERYSSLTALAGQWRSERLTATATLTGTLITERVKFGDAAPDRKHLSPSVSVSYKLFKEANFRLRASYKNSFRVPTFNDLYYMRTGNRNLRPEKAHQFNLGLTWSGAPAKGPLSYARFTADGYYNYVKDKIVARPTLFIWKMMNVGRVQMVGTDLSAEARADIAAGQSMVASGTYSYQYAVDITDPESKTYRHQIPYTPRHSGSAAFSWQNPWVNAALTLAASGKRYALPQNIDTNRIDGYCELNLSLSHDFDLKRVKLHLQGEILNLTDCQYAVIQYYPMPGRSFRINLKITI